VATNFPDSAQCPRDRPNMANDEDSWNYARTNGFVIVSHDSDFYRTGTALWRTRRGKKSSSGCWLGIAASTSAALLFET